MRQQGFTVTELLVVVVVISVISAIAIPNFLGALNRSKQRRSMADLRTISTAVEQYALDQPGYPVTTAIHELGGALEPIYANPLPKTDGWSRPFVVDSALETYTICSNGKDGVGNCTLEAGGATNDTNLGIVISRGEFLQWPDGT